MDMPVDIPVDMEELEQHTSTWLEMASIENDMSSPGSFVEDNSLQPLTVAEIQNYIDFEENEVLEDNVLEHSDSPYIGLLGKIKEISLIANDDLRNQIHQYATDFQATMALRNFFSAKIESKSWHYIQCNIPPTHQQLMASKSIVNELFNLVEALMQSGDELSVADRNSLNCWQHQCKIYYFNNPISFVEVIQKMLKKEQSILDNFEQYQQHTLQLQQNDQMSPHQNGTSNFIEPINANQSGTTFILQNISVIDSHLMTLKENLEKTGNQYKNLQNLCGGQIPILDAAKINQVPEDEKIAWMKLFEGVETCQKNKTTIAQQHLNLMNSLKTVSENIIHQVSIYRNGTSHRILGEVDSNCPDIDRLQDCCKLIGQVIISAIDNVERLSKLKFAENIIERENEIREIMLTYQNIFKALVVNCVVIDKHPNQVLMKEKKFSLELRHLMGTALTQTQFETTVVLINARTYSALLQEKRVEIQKVGKIKVKNNTRDGKTRSTVNSDTGQVTVKFNNMSISIAPRGGDKTKAETVAEEKLTLFFRSLIPITFCNGESDQVECQTFSLPLVVTTHGKQEADANATIFWDNAFHIPNRKSFDVYDKVPWSRVLYFLDLFWRRHCESDPGYEICKSGKGLTPESRRFLTIKLFGAYHQNPSPSVSWKQVSRNQLPGFEFSFWTWFYKIVELVSSSYVKKFWNRNFIAGFIFRQDCIQLLKGSPCGTFMLRFSESQLGSLVISVCKVSDSGKKVISFDPDNIHSFRHKRSLPGNMKDLNVLQILYPNIPKDEAFREYYEPEKREQDPKYPYTRKVCTITADG